MKLYVQGLSQFRHEKCRLKNEHKPDHHFLRIVWSGFLVEKPSCQMSFVVLFESVFFLKESEQNHRFVENAFDFSIAKTFDAFLELVVDEERKVFGRPFVQVKEILEITGDNLEKRQ